MDGELGTLVRRYLDRVVNRRDLTAVDELVSDDYAGGGFGWPADVGALRAFYADQYARRPDWRIDVQESVEVGDSVVVRALAGGTVLDGDRPERRAVEWLAHYRVVDGRIVRTEVLALVPRP